jgi:anhydro-N-acetylmuramic acid kinase
VANIGGIANVTILGTDGSVSGFDTGPGNCLMDAWCMETTGEPYDADGEWARGGEVVDELLQRMLADPYFALPPPKSTGLEYFNLPWLDQVAAGIEAGERDIQRTLAELTAVTMANGLGGHAPARLLVCGGGVHNDFLMSRLSDQLPDCEVASSGDYGAHPDWVEAILFAWLARERLAGRKQDTRSITGAREPVLLGKVYE